MADAQPDKRTGPWWLLFAVAFVLPLFVAPSLAASTGWRLNSTITRLMIVLGGIGTVFGAVWGGIAFAVLSPLLEHLGGALPYVNELTSAQQSTLLFSMLVIGFLVFEPLGLYGIWLRIKRYFMAWPFRY